MTSNGTKNLGTKTLLAALSLAATVGGWAWLTLGERDPESNAPDSVKLEPQHAPSLPESGVESSVVIEFQAMPTVVPLAVPASVEIASLTLPPPAAVVRAPVAAPVPLRIVAVPPPPPPATASEREESSAPAPAAKTRSSR